MDLASSDVVFPDGENSSLEGQFTVPMALLREKEATGMEHVTACDCMSLHVTACHCMSLHVTACDSCDSCDSMRLHATACDCM